MKPEYDRILRLCSSHLPWKGPNFWNKLLYLQITEKRQFQGLFFITPYPRLTQIRIQSKPRHFIKRTLKLTVPNIDGVSFIQNDAHDDNNSWSGPSKWSSFMNGKQQANKCFREGVIWTLQRFCCNLAACKQIVRNTGNGWRNSYPIYATWLWALTLRRWCQVTVWDMSSLALFGLGGVPALTLNVNNFFNFEANANKRIYFSWEPSFGRHVFRNFYFIAFLDKNYPIFFIIFTFLYHFSLCLMIFISFWSFLAVWGPLEKSRSPRWRTKMAATQKWWRNSYFMWRHQERRHQTLLSLLVIAFILSKFCRDEKKPRLNKVKTGNWPKIRFVF